MAVDFSARRSGQRFDQLVFQRNHLLQCIGVVALELQYELMLHA